MNLTRRTALGAGAVFGLSATASRAQSTRWQFATPYPDGNFHTVNNRAFVKEIEAASGGKLAVQVHSNAALLKMGEIKRGVQTGQAQLGEILISSYGNEDPFFEVDGIPQLVTSYAQSRKLADLSRPYIEARLQRQGLSLLYMVPWPPSGFYTNAPVSTLDALKGTKFRTYNVMTSRFATLVGATPTLVQQAELAQAFATGGNNHDSLPVVMPDGAFALFWIRQNGGYFDLAVRRSADGANWEPPIALTDTPDEDDIEPHPLVGASATTVELYWSRDAPGGSFTHDIVREAAAPVVADALFADGFDGAGRFGGASIIRR